MPTRTVKRRQFLESLANETKTMVFYESPKRLKASLGDIEEILGDREIVVSRELTKIHEEILRGNISGIARSLDKKEIKGEITLVVSGGEETAIEWSSEHIRERFAKLREKYRNLSAKDIVGMVSEETKMPKKKIYAQMLEFMEEDAVKDTPICKSQHGKGNL
jgi:16S rRNA (cytidine1402-2'-O)-methyltransferase